MTTVDITDLQHCVSRGNSSQHHVYSYWKRHAMSSRSGNSHCEFLHSCYRQSSWILMWCSLHKACYRTGTAWSTEVTYSFRITQVMTFAYGRGQMPNSKSESHILLQIAHHTNTYVFRLREGSDVKFKQWKPYVTSVDKLYCLSHITSYVIVIVTPIASPFMTRDSDNIWGAIWHPILWSRLFASQFMLVVIEFSVRI